MVVVNHHHDSIRHSCDSGAFFHDFHGCSHHDIIEIGIITKLRGFPLYFIQNKNNNNPTWLVWHLHPIIKLPLVPILKIRVIFPCMIYGCYHPLIIRLQNVVNDIPFKPIIQMNKYHKRLSTPPWKVLMMMRITLYLIFLPMIIQITFAYPWELIIIIIIQIIKMDSFGRVIFYFIHKKIMTTHPK